MSVWKNRIVGLTMEVPEDLLANPFNPRRHPGGQRDAMRGSLNELGWIDAVIVNDTTGRMVDGHLRCEEAISEGTPVIPVLHVELTEEEERLALAIFDPISAMAKNDSERLEDLIASISTTNPALNDLLASLSGEDIDGAPIHPPPKPKAGNTLVVIFADPDTYAEFCGGLNLIPGNGVTDKLTRLVRNAIA
jgi:hypothetical protein